MKTSLPGNTAQQQLEVALAALQEIASTMKRPKGRTSAYGGGFVNYSIKDARITARMALERIHQIKKESHAIPPVQS